MVKQNIAFNKKVVALLIKNYGMPGKERRRIYYWGPLIRAYHWRLKEDPITDDP